MEQAARERAAALPGENLKQLKRDFEAQFRFADENGDGYLSPEEVRGRFPGIAREFARADGDGDGRISLREFFQVRRMQFERKLQK
jgi:Ca2+-binding EF-hand superfamily protein